MLIPMLVTLILLAIFGIFFHRLLAPREVWDFDQSEGRLTMLRKRRDGALRALKDIEYEHEIGALGDEEYYPLRQDLKRRAVRAMKELDRVRSVQLRALSRRPPEGKQTERVSPSLRRRVEALVKERKESS